MSPLWRALLLSGLLHFLVLFGGMIDLSGESDPVPVTISVTIKPVAPPPPSPPPPRPAAAATERQPDPMPARARKTSASNPAAELRKEAAPEVSPPPDDPAPADSPAQLVEAAATPDYPADARANGQQGCVLAAIAVDEKGKVSAVRVLHSDHPGVFDTSVATAQSNARYLPAVQDGQAVSGRALAVAAFALTADAHLDCPSRYAGLASRINSLPPEANLDVILDELLPHVPPPGSPLVTTTAP